MTLAMCAWQAVGWRLLRRLHRGANDLSIVEFHDPMADWETALTQARPGHRRMGIAPEGGTIQPQYVYTQPPRGFFDPASGLLKVIVHGRPLTSVELLDACALRIETRPMQPGPVREVAYVFMQEDEARANLHELWLRGLQCRAIRDGVEVRLDDSYQPAPVPPSWATALLRRLETNEPDGVGTNVINRITSWRFGQWRCR